MTVVLAVVCADGVVMGADTQITDMARGASYPGRKLHRLGEAAAWGGSGARAVQVDLQRAFEHSAGAILDAEDVGRALQEQMLPILRHHYDNFIAEVPGEDLPGTPSAYLLAAGWADDGPWIVEVDPHGMVSRYEDIGFHAIGSGAAMALQASALLAHFRMLERSVHYGVVAVVRVLDALALSSPSVGPHFDVIRVTAEGAHQLDAEEVAEAKCRVERWEDLEQGVLDQLFE